MMQTEEAKLRSALMAAERECAQLEAALKNRDDGRSKWTFVIQLAWVFIFATFMLTAIDVLLVIR